MNFCPECGATLSRKIPAGEDRPRFVCDSCAAIHYQNPKLVVGTIPEFDDRILMCRRAILPARDKWTLPAGYLENGETLEQGAARETLEESGYQVSGMEPYAAVNIPVVDQVYFMFRCSLGAMVQPPGSESLEVRLFTPAEIPWHDIAFPSIHEVLRCYCDASRDGVFRFRMLTAR